MGLLKPTKGAIFIDDNNLYDSKNYGISYWGLGHKKNGIVHVIGPENGITLPGATIVCGDSHTSTHRALTAWWPTACRSPY